MVLLPNNLSDIADACRDALTPPPEQSLWEWAEANIVLTPKTGTFSPGAYRTRHTPHVKTVMEAYQNPDIREIVLPWASQTSKTLTETICCVWAICNDPGNTLFVMPSEQMAKSFSQSRLQRVILDTKQAEIHRLAGLGKWNKLEMELDNCVLALTGANSATNLASRPIRRLFLDEIDKYPPSIKEEGDPITLAKERTKTFPNSCVMESSTPTTENATIHAAFINSTQHEWFCPCPKCRHKFIPEWKCIEFDKEGTDDQRAESVRMVCPNCSYMIREGERRNFVTSGEWQKTHDGQADVYGFRISELASAIGRPWPELVKMWIVAARHAKTGNVELMRSFICSVLAEPWRVETDTLRDATEFYKYCDGYERGTFPGFLPINGLTIGIDTQKNSFWYVVRAWGGGETMESWLVDYGEVATFADLEPILFTVYQDDQGGCYRITSGFIDSGGDKTHEVYSWCRRIGRDAGVLPSKGEQRISGGQRIVMSHLDHDRRGKKVLGGLSLYRINTGYFKDWLDQKLRLDADAPGAWHIFDGVAQDYVKHMSSEYRDENGVWVTRGLATPNHLWDCEVYALAAAINAHMDRNIIPRDDDEETEQNTETRRRW